MKKEICPNCGMKVSELELNRGPDGLGCEYCTVNCPHCGMEVYDIDILAKDDMECCVYCEDEFDELNGFAD